MKKTMLLILISTISMTFLKAEELTIVFNVKTPKTAPEGEIYITGNDKALGDWNPKALKMNKVKDFEYSLSLKIKKGTRLEYKYTKGDWQTVEKSGDESEIENRTFIAEKDLKIFDKVENWANTIKQNSKDTVSGDIEPVKTIYSKNLGAEKEFLIYLPPSYKKNKNKKYPVIYMHDGQNLFNARTSFSGNEWQVDEAAEKLFAKEPKRETIIVGILNNADRLNEYTPWKDEQRGGGKGEKYISFIVYELMPLINENYRTIPDAENTSIAGSSLGGLISLYAILEYPTKFSQSAVISPSLYWADKKIFSLAKEKADSSKMKIYLSMGELEGSGDVPTPLTITLEMEKLLKDKGFKENLFMRQVQNGKHNEKYWAIIFPEILYFLTESGEK